MYGFTGTLGSFFRAIWLVGLVNHVSQLNLELWELVIITAITIGVLDSVEGITIQDPLVRTHFSGGIVMCLVFLVTLSINGTNVPIDLLVVILTGLVLVSTIVFTAIRFIRLSD